jgi:hypothetical protein
MMRAMPLLRSFRVPLAGLALVSLAACAGPTAGGGRAASAHAPADFFPLAVGNEWAYVDESPALPPEQRGAVRTVRILARDAEGFFRDNERGELRAGADCLQDRVRRLLCAPVETGHRWTSVVSAASTERYEIAAVDERVETPAGRFDGCVKVRAHNRAAPSTDHVLEITYAPGVGPVRIETFVITEGAVRPQVRALLRSYQLEGK